MKVVRGEIRLPRKFPKPILTIGNFDGIHLGHRAILQTIVARAKMVGGTSVVLTFEPHPVTVLTPGKEFTLLSTLEEKLRLIEREGVDLVIVASFTDAFAAQSPEAFMRDILAERIGVAEIYVGRDYAFGKGRAGRVEDLRRAGDALNFSVHVMEPVLFAGTVVSSSLIRGLLKDGAVTEAAKFLGQDYTIEGEVLHGEGRGRELGYPTANILPAGVLIPKDGIYAVRTVQGSDVYLGVAYIGTQPTFGGKERRVEVHLFGFHENLYGSRIRVSFVEYLRGDQTFSGPEELVRQIEMDVARTREIFSVQPRG